MSDQATLLVADDDEAVRLSLERALTREGYGVVLAPDGQAALDRLRQGGVDLLLSDLRMPGLTGLELLKLAKEVAPDVDVILLTAFGTVEEAVRAMKDGAIDFLTKPLQRAQLLRVVRQALERRSLIQQNRALQRRLDDLLRQGNAIGVSPAFKQMMTLVQQVADSSATVLIQGESGTGKELAARAIHDGSPRHAGPFVAVNCAALPETLLESELFGYEKGAFTGAAGRKEGRFELADGGTLFLDEIAEMSAALQAKYLRVLQDGVVRRLGGRTELKVDVRIIAATNRDPREAIKQGAFREDLYYRLNVFSFTMPPLRVRKGDIPLLAGAFVTEFAGKYDRAAKGLSAEALETLARHSWPGNVRELRNCLERAVVGSTGSELTGALLPLDLPPLPEADGASSGAPSPPLLSLDEAERLHILRTLAALGSNKTRTAETLGISLKTLHNKLRRYRESRG